MRIGIGYDIHPLKKGRKLVLGGVPIPFEKGLDGHSDGDALIHAIVDAVLGALGEGDIGSHFSDKDPKNAAANSLIFLKKARLLLHRHKMSVENLDSIVIAEAPKLGPWKEKMRKSIAAELGVPVSTVSIKAKTNEGFGPIGKGKAIACYAVVSLKKGR